MATTLQADRCGAVHLAVTPAALVRPEVLSLPHEASGCTIPSQTPWYALVVRSNRAFQIRDKLRDQGIDEFLPTYTETTRWSDRTKISTRQLFPGYLFVRCDADASPILDLPGVVQILPSNLNPVSIDPDEISSLRITLASQVPVSLHAYVVGGKVTIKSGPLSGVSGVVVRTGNSVRVIVGIEMMGRALSVPVDAGDLEKAA